MCSQMCRVHAGPYFLGAHICASVCFERQKEERALERVGVCVWGGGAEAEELTCFERQSFIRTHEPRFVVFLVFVVTPRGAPADCMHSPPLHASGCILRRTYAT